MTSATATTPLLPTSSNRLASRTGSTTASASTRLLDPVTDHLETEPDAAVAQQRDEVDDLVAAWRRERPDLDVTPLEVLSRITRLARHLDRARGQAFSRHGLEGWEFDV